MSRTQETMLSVAEVVEMVPGDDENASWINPGFIAQVSDIKSTTVKSTGKPMHICTLIDTAGSANISMTVFTKLPGFDIGDTIEVSGKGLRRSEYKGLDQVSVGRETEIRVVRAGTGRPTTKANAPLNSESVDSERRLTTQGKVPVYGATVGMAIKESLAIHTRDLQRDTLMSALCSKTFWLSVHETSSDIIRVAQNLEQGHLAKSVTERTEGASPRVPKRGEAIPGSEEDVPF